MSSYISALLYEGILAISFLFLYFWIEPRVSKNKKSFMYVAFCALISLPFIQFLVGFILQSQSCETKNNFFCVGTPDIVTHSFYYDIVFLRVNDTINGAHWIVYMFLPILFFITFYFTKDVFYSALNAGFMVFIHEVIWFLFYWLRYFDIFMNEGWFNDIAFFMLVCSIGFIGLKKYGKYYSTTFFFFGLFVYLAYLELWFLNGFKVTVINNTALGNSRLFLETIWYNDPTTNFWEIGSWVIIFSVFVINIVLYWNWKRKLDEYTMKELGIRIL